MHLVEIAVEPVEEAPHAIPLIHAFVIVRLALHDEFEFFFVELGPWDVRADLVFFGCPLQVAQALAVDGSLKGANGSVVD